MTILTLAVSRKQTVDDDEHDDTTSPEGAAPRSLSRTGAAGGRLIVKGGDEEEIQARLDARDARGAIAACARAYGVSIGRLCYAMLGVQSEAEEATQETLLAAYDGVASFRGEGAVRAWLYGIARRICARRLEVRTRQDRRSKLLAENDQDAPAADTMVDAARRGAAVRVALAELRPTEREAVLLRFESDLSFKEVADACGIDEAAARKRVSRALAKLRERLAE